VVAIIISVVSEMPSVAGQNARLPWMPQMGSLTQGSM
jgi:hypothetical protein